MYIWPMHRYSKPTLCSQIVLTWHLPFTFVIFHGRHSFYFHRTSGYSIEHNVPLFPLHSHCIALTLIDYKTTSPRQNFIMSTEHCQKLCKSAHNRHVHSINDEICDFGINMLIKYFPSTSIRIMIHIITQSLNID